MKRVFLSKKDNHKYFKEYIESICDGDEILLWDGNSILEPNRFYMCVGEVPRSKIPPSCKIAYINVEQLSDPARLNEYNSIIKDGIEIYDYSRDNIRISGKGTYLPYKENPAETAKLKSFMNVKKEYLVATVGNMSNRRTDIIKNIVSNGIMVKQVSGWEDDRDREIGKAHILLNIHHSDTYNIYEAIRCERWRFAGMPIVSEISSSPMPEGIIESNLNDFLPKIVTKLEELVIPKKLGGSDKGIELVIARYTEDIRWINDLPKGLLKRIKIYNKGPDMGYLIEGAEVIKLENIGREPHTYLTHIVDNYNNGDSNDSITLFLPGSVKNKPYKSIQLDKILDSLKHNHASIILSVASDKESIEKEKGLQVNEYSSSNNDNKKYNPNTRVNRSHDGPMGKWFAKYFPGEEIKCLSINCIFAVTKADIHKRTLDTYKNLLDMVSSSHPEVGHYLERLWSIVLSIDNCELYDIKGHPHVAYKAANTSSTK